MELCLSSRDCRRCIDKTINTGERGGEGDHRKAIKMHFGTASCPSPRYKLGFKLNTIDS